MADPKKEPTEVADGKEPTPGAPGQEGTPWGDLLLDAQAHLESKMNQVLELLESDQRPGRVTAENESDLIAKIVALLDSATPSGMVAVVDTDLKLDQAVKVSHLEPPDSPYTGHTGRLVYIPPDGEWPFVVAFHPGGESPAAGDRFPTTFRRNEIEPIK